MAVTTFQHDELVFLLGAGASVDAGIPDSNEMVRRIEHEISNGQWNEFLELYRYLRSSVVYADGLEGMVGSDVRFDIERLVNVLDELQKKERHTLYPFVGAWNPKLQELAGMQFERIRTLRSLIIGVLRDKWVQIEKREDAEYYRGLLRFQNQFGFPLRVFSLNYDLCLETVCGHDSIQRGFDGRNWDWRSYEGELNEDRLIFLYKLHGSVDWCFTNEGIVSYSDSSSTIPHDQVAMIFGTSYKLQYIDPFLFLAYELRRWTLEAARLIVTVGYGFMDEHINGILGQSLHQDSERKLLVVVEQKGEEESSLTQKFIIKQLGIQDNQVVVWACGARRFFEEKLSLAGLASLFPTEENLFPVIGEPSIEHRVES